MSDETLDNAILEIPDETPKATFGDIINYFSERIDKEIRLQLSGKDLLTPHGEKKQKFEEIKQLARDVFVHNNCCIDSVGAWEEAEKFYDYTKQKQEEMLNA